MGEHLGPNPSPVQQLGDYKGHRELGGVFWCLQHLRALLDQVLHGPCMSTAPAGIPEEVWSSSSCSGTLAWGSAV